MQWNPCRQKNSVKPRRGDRITDGKFIIGLQILIFNIGGLQIRLNWVVDKPPIITHHEIVL